MKIAGIYLAAGNSRRMGRHKLALPLGEMTVGSVALKTALKSSLDDIYIIIKDTDDVAWLPPELKSNIKCTFITCSTSYKGQSESLRSGIKHAQINKMDAVIIMLADQPFITVHMLEDMIIDMKNNPTCKFVATAYEKSMMPPVLFVSSMYNELLKLRGDKGARAILQSDFQGKGKTSICTDKKHIFDVDTKSDYQTLKTFNLMR